MKRALIATAALVLCSCSSEKQAAAPPKPGTLAHSWYSAGEAYKAGDYPKAMEYLSRVAATNSEYKERAKAWLIVVAAGVADGAMELSNAYEDGARMNKDVSMAYRNKMREARNLANAAALQFAETVHEVLDKNTDPQFKFDFEFPTGDTSDPMQMAKIRKGLSMQDADHEVVLRGMTQRGVVRFAEALAGGKDAAKFREPARDVALKAIATGLIGQADLYCQRKLDMPKRGNALCTEALEAIALLPESKEKKELDAKARTEMKRHKITS